MEPTIKPTITEILMAAEAKKKKYRYHPFRRRFNTWMIWIAITATITSMPILIATGIGKQIQEDSANAFYNIKKEVNHYYNVNIYATPVDEDTNAKMARIRSQSYQSTIFLFPFNVEFSPRSNPQSAIANYFISFKGEGTSRLNHTLTASLSIMDDGRRWRINTVEASLGLDEP
jgi:hypothetical protein